jgi:hypothetical protein
MARQQNSGQTTTAQPSMQEMYEQLPETYQKVLYKLARKMLSQAEKGREKYGFTMDDNPSRDTGYWHNHFMEELSDGLVYLQKLLSIYEERSERLKAESSRFKDQQ